jgi:hypothetical protein
MSKLMDKLSEMMPPQPPPAPNAKMIAFQSSPIRAHAKAFAASMPEMPKDHGELLAVLWVFGEQVSGDMERRMNYALKIANDAVGIAQPSPVCGSNLSEHEPSHTLAGFWQDGEER